MNRYATFLRAINVGGRTVTMDVLRGIFNNLGFKNVQTYIQSGNVIFETAENETAALESRIAARLESELGYAVPAFIRTGPELAAIAQNWPFDQVKTADHVLYVSFLQGPPEPSAARAVADLEDGIMQFFVDAREVYWLRDKSAGNSKITNATIEKTLGLPATRRSINTVQKMVKKYFV